MNENSSELWKKIRVGVYLAFTILAFSSMEVLANPIRDRIDPFALTFWRFLLGAAFLFPFAWPRLRHADAPISRKDYFKLAFLGCLNVILSMGAHAVSVKYAKASTAAILIASNPIATNLLAWVILGESLTKRRGISLLIGVFGVIMISLHRQTGVDTTLGVIAGIIGMVGFALYSVLSKDIVKRLGSMSTATVSFSFAVLIYLPLLWVSGVQIWPASDLWIRLLILGIIVSGLGYVTFFKALAELPVGKASLLFFFKPPVAIFLAWIILGETPALGACFGTILIMAAILSEK